MSLVLKFCGGFFWKSLSYLYEMGRTNFSADFGLFGIFQPDFAKTVAASSDENKNYLTLPKGQSILKK